jgi:hypothetical protein
VGGNMTCKQHIIFATRKYDPEKVL